MTWVLTSAMLCNRAQFKEQQANIPILKRFMEKLMLLYCDLGINVSHSGVQGATGQHSYSQTVRGKLLLYYDLGINVSHAV